MAWYGVIGELRQEVVGAAYDENVLIPALCTYSAHTV
jgi:hypothetical protein